MSWIGPVVPFRSPSWIPDIDVMVAGAVVRTVQRSSVRLHGMTMLQKRV